MGGLERGFGPDDVGASGVDVFLARTFHHQRQSLVGMAKNGSGAVQARAVLIVLLLGNVVVLEEILRAIPIGLGLIVLGLGVGHGSAGFLTANITGHGDTYTAGQAGINIDPRAGIGNTGFAPSLNLGMTQYLGNPQTTIDGSLLGAPVGATPFQLPSKFDRTAFDVAPSISLNQRPGQMNVRLSGDYRVSGRSQGLTASINLEQRF